jgi:ribosomal protein S18 acetylase RimI-like enzyme
MTAPLARAGVVEVQDDAAVLACHALVLQLRPALLDAQEWLARFKRQAQAGYRVFALVRAQRFVGLAGFRVQENLIHQRFLYVDDLVTHAGERSSGLGAQLLEALTAEARAQGCHKLVLDTALANALAHRFYYRQGLVAQGLHFSMPLSS